MNTSQFIEKNNILYNQLFSMSFDRLLEEAMVYTDFKVAHDLKDYTTVVTSDIKSVILSLILAKKLANEQEFHLRDLQELAKRRPNLRKVIVKEITRRLSHNYLIDLLNIKREDKNFRIAGDKLSANYNLSVELINNLNKQNTEFARIFWDTEDLVKNRAFTPDEIFAHPNIFTNTAEIIKNPNITVDVIKSKAFAEKDILQAIENSDNIYPLDILNDSFFIVNNMNHLYRKIEHNKNLTVRDVIANTEFLTVNISSDNTTLKDIENVFDVVNNDFSMISPYLLLENNNITPEEMQRITANDPSSIDYYITNNNNVNFDLETYSPSYRDENIHKLLKNPNITLKIFQTMLAPKYSGDLRELYEILILNANLSLSEVLIIEKELTNGMQVPTSRFALSNNFSKDPKYIKIAKSIIAEALEPKMLVRLNTTERVLSREIIYGLVLGSLIKKKQLEILLVDYDIKITKDNYDILRTPINWTKYLCYIDNRPYFFESQEFVSALAKMDVKIEKMYEKNARNNQGQFYKELSVKY
jgi:uncharacterized protein YfkK (UPF0435 family)